MQARTLALQSSAKIFMLPEIGQFALILALMLALTQATLPLIGAAKGIPQLVALARPTARRNSSLSPSPFRFSPIHSSPTISQC